MRTRIPFHEGREFIWNKAAHEVRTPSGGLVSGAVYNMDQAREQARAYNKRVEEQDRRNQEYMRRLADNG